MAAHNGDVGDSVTIKLVADENIKDIPKRSVTLTDRRNKLQIGRASKVATKGFVPAHDNGWFESPVMSRNHAEIVYDLHQKAVYIRDIGSLHGTFINDDVEHIQPDNLVEIQDGCRVTFGVPILRNSEAFSPATIEVGIRHGVDPKYSPAAGSTFALPEDVDDETSSSDDDSGEEPPVSHSQDPTKPTVVDLTEGHGQVEMVDLTDTEMSGDRAHNLIDLTSPARVESPDVGDGHEEDEEEAGEEADQEDVQILDATATILDNIVESGSDHDGSDIGTPSSDDSDMEPESIHLSSDEEETDFSDSSELGTDDARSDDDEGIDSDEEGGWDVEYSSGDDVLDEDDPDTAIWEHAEEPAVSSVLANQETTNDKAASTKGNHDDEGFAASKSDHAMAEVPDAVHMGDVMPSNPVPESAAQPMQEHLFPFAFQAPPPRVTLPSLLNPLLNLESPSDGQIPKRDGPFSFDQTSGSSSTAEALGEKTGKREFFAAREENRLRLFAPSRGSPAPSVNGGPFVQQADRFADRFGPTPSQAMYLQPMHSQAMLHLQDLRRSPPMQPVQPMQPIAVEKAVVAEKTTVHEERGIEKARPEHATTAAVTTSSFASNQTVALTPLLRTGDRFLYSPPERPSTDFDLPRYARDDTDDPISAFELQKRKVAAQNQFVQTTAEPARGEVTRRTHVGISDIVDRSSSAAAAASEPEPEQKALSSSSSVAGVKGGSTSISASPSNNNNKRKADEMAELTEPEVQWEAAESRLLRHLRAADVAMAWPVHQGRASPSRRSWGDATSAFVSRAAAARRIQPAAGIFAKRVQLGGVQRPAAAAARSSDEQAPKRPRLRKFAERLGYAALGGATVGAALVSTLIYTAPTFT